MLDTKFWDKYFKVYDVLNIVIPYQELLNKICNELEIKPKEKILDAGSGTGNLAILIKRRGGNPVAFDNAKEALKRHKKKDNQAVIVYGDLAEKLPFSDNYFDKLCSNNVLYTIPKNKRGDVLREFYRVLKPGGKIVISNIHKGFSPFFIYWNHIKKDFQKRGFLKLIKDIFIMLPDTIKMFYYNAKIKKEHRAGDFDFLEINEQKDLLKEAGFVNISNNYNVYANQAILNSAYKK